MRGKKARKYNPYGVTSQSTSKPRIAEDQLTSVSFLDLTKISQTRKTIVVEKASSMSTFNHNVAAGFNELACILPRASQARSKP